MLRIRIPTPACALALALVCGGAWSAAHAETSSVVAPAKQLLWGDTHLHSSNSFDAYLNLNHSVDPDTAYRFAKGQPVIQSLSRTRVQLETPLDFLVVADHAEYLGVMRHVVERGVPKDDLGWLEWGAAHYAEYMIRDVVAEDTGNELFNSFLPAQTTVEEAAANPPEATIPAAGVMQRTTWLESIETADAHNEPGVFTTLIGWEWSSIPSGANLHRVVFTDSDASVAKQFQPWSSLDSMYPEDLWKFLDETSAKTGAQFVAMPHNSNISKGYMFTDKTLRGAPYTPALARQRQRLEPVVEVTQYKGDSETHPSVSPEDRFADFEPYPHYIQNAAPPYDPKPGDFVRAALLLGLSIEESIGFNPYRFGLIGSTDSHTGLATAEEGNFWGKFPRDSIPEGKRGSRRIGSGERPGPTGWSMSASGLAAVWAPENTRSAILDAFRRREVYATTGPRIVVQVGAGWSEGANETVMGGELAAHAGGGGPWFEIEAAKDPKSAHLDRVQIVKGWIAEGRAHERIYDVAWSGGRVPGPAGALPLVGNTVDPKTARYTNTIGAATLTARWQDPDFDDANAAFYYVRVLEIPTPRHSLRDAIALGLGAEGLDGPWWLQERAYTSPVWYRPEASANAD